METPSHFVFAAVVELTPVTVLSKQTVKNSLQYLLFKYFDWSAVKRALQMKNVIKVNNDRSKRLALKNQNMIQIHQTIPSCPHWFLNYY